MKKVVFALVSSVLLFALTFASISTETAQAATEVNLTQMKLPLLKQSSIKLASADDYIVEDEPNDSIRNANKLPLNTTIAGAFSTDFDKDMYKIAVKETGTLRIAGSYYGSSSIELIFGLSDKNGKIFEIDDIYEDEEDDLVTQVFTYENVKPGTYYIKAMDSGQYFSGDPYVLLVDYEDTTPPKTLTVNKVTSKTTTVTGKTEAKAIVQVKLGSKVLGKATADSKGNFKVKIKAQKKGKKLTIIASDKAGNSKKVSVTVK
ncbi:Ig-like domain-containing protein [Peribacillus asahii]|uniref:Ig-like domain-containing protein n=1 Tax=Peribacillus asahii TaxID=228899 RepID=UPI00381E8EEA